MSKFKFLSIALVALVLFGCIDLSPKQIVSDTGIKKARATISTGSDGLTVEQRNVKHRIEEDNKIGAIKHLYVISAMSGQVLIYSTVDGKVTSGGKRLTNPQTLTAHHNGDYGMSVMDNIQDDGTYGSSMEYLFWWDVKGVYHQHYVTGGQILHISDQAIPVSNITINLSK